MIQGSNMVLGKGMRKGISLVEMLIAIVLFGVLSVISFKYVKTFYDVELASKQVRISALVEQATQLTNAHDIFTTKYGAAPALITDLNSSTVGILSDLPTTITEIGSAGTGWKYTLVADLSSGADGAITTGTDASYYFDLGALADDAKYCAAFNNMIDSTTSLTADASTAFISTTFNKDAAAYANMYCVGTDIGTGVGPYRIIFVK